MSENENPDNTAKILNTSRSEKVSLSNKNQYKKIKLYKKINYMLGFGLIFTPMIYKL